MVKSELRNFVKSLLVDHLSTAYYRISDNEEDLRRKYKLTDADINLMLQLCNQYGKAMCKAIGEQYYTS